MSGNTLGTLFCVTSFGESHGPAIGCVVDGCPPGHGARGAPTSSASSIAASPGTSRHVTQRRESDTVEILSGVFEGRTTGTPIALLIRNEDPRSKDYAAIADTFRPGHADYAYWQKYGIRDYRGGGRASARETAVRVAAGAIARKWLAERHGVAIRGHLVQLGPHVDPVRGLGARRREPVLRRQRVDRRRARGVHGRAAQVRRLLRREDHRRRDRRAGRLGRAGLRPARRRSRRRDDGHQRGEGRRDRRRLRERRAARHRALRRDDAGGLPLEQRGRHPRRHLDRAGHRRDDRGEADVVDPPRPPLDRQGGQSGHRQHARPARSVRRHSRDADRRGDARARADRPRAAPPRAERRRRRRRRRGSPPPAPADGVARQRTTRDARSTIPSRTRA